MASVGKPTYGPGRIFLTSNSSVPTPARPRYVQDMGFDWKAKADSLFSEDRFPVAVANGPTEVTGKASYSSSNVRLWADGLTGNAASSGKTVEADDETNTISGTTATVANAATFTKDRGVVSASNVPMVRVASAPSAGVSYSVNESTGVYTFGAGEVTGVKISYLYTVASVGATISMTNQKQGPGLNVQVDMVFPYGTEQDVVSFYNCSLTDGGVSTKQGFAGMSVGFMAACNDNNILGALYFARAG